MNQLERGQVTVLILGITLVTLAVSGLAVDGTRAFLARRTLQNLADSASLAGASEIDTTAYYSSEGRVVQLEPQRARDMAAGWVAARELALTTADITADESTVSVTLWSHTPTLFLRLLGVDRVRVSATANAEPMAEEVP